MFLNFVAVNEKVVNLNAVALIEDQSTEEKSVAVLTTIDGIEIQLENEDADALMERADLLIQATDKVIAQLQNAQTSG